MRNNKDIGKWDSYIFLWKPKKSKNEYDLILLSLINAPPCKNEWKIWMIVSLYSEHIKVRFNEYIKKQVRKHSDDQKVRFNEWNKLCTNDCKCIMMYSAKIFAIHHTDQYGNFLNR